MLSIIIPAYNEELRIGATIERLKDFLFRHKLRAEIIVASDGSDDKTEQIAESKGCIVISSKINKGKGSAVRTGILNSGRDIVMFMDADMSVPLNEITKFLVLIKKYDVVIGSRAVNESAITVRQPEYRHAIGKTYNKIARLLTFRKIKDSQCGFKMFRRKAAIDIFKRQRIDGFAFDAETVFLAQKLGYSIKEQGVVWKNDKRSKVRPIRDAVKMLAELVSIRLNWWLGRYNVARRMQ